VFRALPVHLQEALHKRHLVYIVRVMSVGWTNPGAANWHDTHAIYQVSLMFMWPETTRCENYAVLLPQHVSGTNMPIIRSTINKDHILRAVLTPSCPALHNPGGFPGMATKYRKLLILLLMMGILLPLTSWGNNTAYFVVSSWFFTFTISNVVCAVPPKDEHVLLDTCTGP
jgi:hypothetical protein